MARRVEIPEELKRGPFRVEDAAQLGVSRDVVQSKRFRRVFRGVYVLAERPDSVELRLDAARLLIPGAVASHHTAARLRGLPVPGHDHRVHLTVAPPGRERHVTGIKVHVAQIGRSIQTIGGRPALSAGRTLLDLASVDVPLVDLIVFGDAAVRRGWTTRPEVVRHADEGSGRGVRRARRAAGLVHERVDSPMETWLRLLLVLAGLPPPEVNRPVNVMFGWLITPDLSYPAAKIALEYDGDHHRTDRRQWAGDRQRRRDLRELGWELLECVVDDVFRHPEQTLAWTHERLLSAGYPGVPQTLSDAWREHWQRPPTGGTRRCVRGV